MFLTFYYNSKSTGTWFLLLSLQKVSKTKLSLPQMNNYQNPFRFDEQCVPKIWFYIYFNLLKIINFCKYLVPKVWFCVSRNCKNFTQILISYFTKIRENSQNSKKISRNTKLKNRRLTQGLCGRQKSKLHAKIWQYTWAKSPHFMS